MERDSTLKNFALLKFLGKNSLTKLIIVQKKDNKQLYLLQVIKKQKTKDNQPQFYMISTFSKLRHSFILQTQLNFQNSKRLFYTYEYVSGGNLFKLLQTKKILTENQAKFYAAQLLLVLNYLHQNKLTYPSLKPKNILIDHQGYIKVINFNLITSDIYYEQKSDFQLEYVPPEVLQTQVYTENSDWWLFGSFIFEMLTGIPPFYSCNTEDMLNKIQNHELRLLPNISENLQNLLLILLQKNPQNRTFYQNEQSQNLQNHPWFAGINWDLLLNKQILPPFKPFKVNQQQVINFDDVEYNQTPESLLRDSLNKKLNSYKSIISGAIIPEIQNDKDQFQF